MPKKHPEAVAKKIVPASMHAILSASSDEDDNQPPPQKRPREAMSPDGGSPPPPRFNASSSSSSGDENHVSPSHVIQDNIMVQEEGTSRGRSRARGRGSRTGRPRQQQYSDEIEDRLVEFYRSNPCFYDKKDPNYINKPVKDNLLANFSNEVNIDTHLINKWYETERRYYTQNVQNPKPSSGSAAKAPTEKYDWSARNFSFLDGHTRPTTQRNQLGSGVSI